MLEWLTTKWDDVLTILAYIIAAASVIVRLTPTPKDDAFLKPLYDWVNKYVALNKPK
jgi:hypothetical protein